MNFTRLFVVLILISASSAALSVTSDSQLQTISGNGVADFYATVSSGSSSEKVAVTYESELPVTVSDDYFYLSKHDSEEIRITASAAGVSDGTYLIKVSFNDEEEYFVVNVVNSSKVLMISSAYSKMAVIPGQYSFVKAVVSNFGSSMVKNIVISGDIPGSLSPEYPDVFSLARGESRTVSVKVLVPYDYQLGQHVFTLTASSGSLSAESSVIVSVDQNMPAEESLSLLVSGISAYSENGTVKGYTVKLRVINRGMSEVNGLSIDADVPSSWQADSDVFNVSSFGSAETVMTIIPDQMADKKVNIFLMMGSNKILSKEVQLESSKAGVPTGMFLFGGSSLWIGIAALALILAFVFFMRTRNAVKDKEEDSRTKAYLESLVQKVKAEKEGESKK